MAHEIWQKDDVQEQKKTAYKRISEFYHKNELLVKSCDDK